MAEARITAKRDLPSDKVRGFIERAAMRFGGLDGREAARLSGKIVTPLVALTPLGFADDAVTETRANTAALRRGEHPAALGGPNVAMSALGMIPGGRGAKVALGEAVGGAKGIIAYHGSPHKFDRFDMSKIGTGEGAQAYGHGLYFAENEAVARGYREALSGPSAWVPKRGRDGSAWDTISGFMSDGYDFERSKAEAIRRAEDSLMWARMHKRRLPDDPEIDNVIGRYEREVADLQTVLAKDFKNKSPGHLYQVRINADPADFLDWDAPLAVREDIGAVQNDKGLWQGAIRGVPVDNATWANPEYAIEKARAKPGKALVGAGSPGAFAGGDFSARRSQELAQAGIPGIRYLDAGSRGAGDGSRNYVVFDDKLIEILKRYAWVPGTAIPAAAMADWQAAGGPAGVIPVVGPTTDEIRAKRQQQPTRMGT